MTDLPVWSFKHNWQNGLSETLEWLTTVLVSQTGAEQRLQQRYAPRRFFEYSLILTDQERAYFDLAVTAWGGKDWMIPVLHDSEVLAAPLVPGQTMIPMDTMNREFLTGSKVLVSAGDARYFEILRIDQVIESGLTLITPVVGNWNSGSVMSPLIAGHMLEQPEVKRRGSNVWQGNVKFRSIDENNWPIGTNLNVLLNEDGLVVNAFQPQSGRGAYFDQASGTSEGQLILCMGLMDAANMLGDSRAYTLAQRMLDATMATTYNGADPPTLVTQTATFAPHWLFVVKKPIKACVVNYGEKFTFNNGVAQVPDVHGPTRLVFRALSTDYALLWQNPYSSLKKGTEYHIQSYSYDAVNEVTNVYLQDTTVNDDLVVIYSSQNGNTLDVGDRYEAWPDWRPLAAGETDCACDTLNWAYRAFVQAGDVFASDYYAACGLATAQQTDIIYDVNDSRDWIKPSFTKNAFGDGSRFSFATRGSPVVFDCDDQGNVLMTVETGTGEAQYGNASIKDVYHAGDQTVVNVGSTRAVDITCYIDESQFYDYNTRWSCTLSLSGSGQPQQFILTHKNFTRVDGTVMPDETPVYTFGFDDKATRSHTLIIGRVRQLPNLTIPYYKGAIPFTANFLGQPYSVLIDWRGPIYMGYQSPWMWDQMGEYVAAANCVKLLNDAQQKWYNDFAPNGQGGPFTPVFIFDRADAYQYGDANTFTWVGPDPNTGWGGYQYRPVPELAEFYRNSAKTNPAAHAMAGSVVNNYLGWLDVNWPGGHGSGPPTEFFPDGTWEIGYDEPHFAALIIRAVIHMDLFDRPSHQGPMKSPRASLLNKALAFWKRTYVSDPTNRMYGTFCTDFVNLSWFGFWHGEIMRTFKLLNDWSIATNTPAVTALMQTYMQGLLDWAWTNSLQPDPLPTYNGYDVLVDAPNDREDQTYKFTRLINEIDNTIATPIEQDEAQRAFPIQDHSWQLIGRAEHYKFRSLMYRLKGRQKPMYVPTFNQDLVVAVPCFMGATTLLCEYIAYTTTGGATQIGKTDIVIFYNDGTVSCHTILAAHEYGPGIEAFNIRPALPSDVAPETVYRISFMQVGRLDTDTIEIKHYTNNEGVSEIGLTFKMVGDYRNGADYTIQPNPDLQQNDNFTHFPPPGVDQTTVIYGYDLNNGNFGRDDSDVTEVLYPPAIGQTGTPSNVQGNADTATLENGGIPASVLNQ